MAIPSPRCSFSGGFHSDNGYCCWLVGPRVVLDDRGQPLAGAHVVGIPEENFKAEISTTSDARGTFTLTNVPTGLVYVGAYKESDGYPNAFFAFYNTSDQAWVKANVEAGGAAPYVVIKLGPKAAYLTIEITDQNGKPVEAQLLFTREDGKEGSKPYSRSAPPANESVMVPPVRFRLTVQADGYESWHYGGQAWQGKDGLINLKSGEKLSLSVQLRPLQ